MQRPLLMRLLNGRLRSSLFHRIYLPRSADGLWSALFKGTELALVPSVKLNLVQGDFMHAEIAFTGIYEEALSRQIVELGREGGLLVDVGANAGYFSLLWAATNQANRVIAIEASPRNVPMLKANVEMNGCGNRITVLDVALGRSEGIMQFDLGPSHLTGWGGVAVSAGPNTVEVPLKTLDSLINSDELVELLKIDVEGADTWVLLGADKLLRSKRVRSIWYEQNKPRLRPLGIGDNDAQSYLESVGYRARPVSDPSADVVDWVAVAA